MHSSSNANEGIRVLEEIVCQAIPLEASRKKIEDFHSPKKVFIWHSRKDNKSMIELRNWLSSLRGLALETWGDADIGRWKFEIHDALETADAAILLVSIDLLNSQFINDLEWPLFLAECERRNLPICLVLVTKVRDDSPLRNRQFLNSIPLEVLNPAQRNDVWAEVYDWVLSRLGGANQDQ